MLSCPRMAAKLQGGGPLKRKHKVFSTFCREDVDSGRRLAGQGSTAPKRISSVHICLTATAYPYPQAVADPSYRRGLFSLLHHFTGNLRPKDKQTCLATAVLASFCSLHYCFLSSSNPTANLQISLIMNIKSSWGSSNTGEGIHQRSADGTPLRQLTATGEESHAQVVW